MTDYFQQWVWIYFSCLVSFHVSTELVTQGINWQKTLHKQIIAGQGSKPQQGMGLNPFVALLVYPPTTAVTYN